MYGSVSSVVWQEDEGYCSVNIGNIQHKQQYNFNMTRCITFHTKKTFPLNKDSKLNSQNYAQPLTLWVKIEILITKKTKTNPFDIVIVMNYNPMREDTFLFEYLISINCYICLIGHASLANTNIVVWHSQTFTETLCGKRVWCQTYNTNLYQMATFLHD